jgi:hypothetical protein
MYRRPRRNIFGYHLTRHLHRRHLLIHPLLLRFLHHQNRIELVLFVLPCLIEWPIVLVKKVIVLF